MINAGLVILGFDGQQMFDSDVGMWVGIKVRVNYPLDQNANDNPISEGDLIIEQNGEAWKVEQAELEDQFAGTFRVALSSVLGETTEERMPSLAETILGAVTTPKNGFVATHWDSGMVSQEASRMAAILTMELYEPPTPGQELPDDVWAGEVDLT